jgi:hypothetical protein
MSELQWAALAVGGMLGALIAIKAWNKDTKGATAIALGVLLAGALFVVSGCSVTPAYRPWMEIGMAYDASHTVGSDPACIVRIRQPLIPDRLFVGYEHHSSCRDQDDKNVIDQIEVMAKIPLGRKK